jgi:hypothetical protein
MQRGWIRQSVRILEVRNRLLPAAILLYDALCYLFPAMKAVVAAGRRPDRQDGEGLVARRATTAPDTDDIVNFVVRLFAPLAVADDRAVPTERTPAWQQVQRERGHPGSRLSSASGSAIKRINGWREGLPLTVAAKFSICEPAFTLRQSQSRTKKEYRPQLPDAIPHSRALAGIKASTARKDLIGHMTPERQ